MKVNDKVKWISQSQGYRKRKTGIIVEVVEAGLRIDHTINSDSFKHDPLTIRSHESYIVRVDGKRGGQKYYWPLVKNLVQIK